MWDPDHPELCQPDDYYLLCLARSRRQLSATLELTRHLHIDAATLRHETEATIRHSRSLVKSLPELHLAAIQMSATDEAG
jgi:hypothetical protein